MISRDVLEDVIAWWRDEINREKIIEREILVDVEKTLDMEEVTVIRGVRRAGKTFILYSLLRKHGGIYINFEDERLAGFSVEDFEKITDIIKAEGVHYAELLLF